MLLRDSWERLPKTILGGQVYAKIGDWNYSRHAINMMQPCTYGTHHTEIKKAIKKTLEFIDEKKIKQKPKHVILKPGRTIPPSAVEDIIKHGSSFPDLKDPNLWICFMDYIEVVIHKENKVVVSVKKTDKNSIQRAEQLGLKDVIGGLTCNISK